MAERFPDVTSIPIGRISCFIQTFSIGLMFIRIRPQAGIDWSGVCLVFFHNYPFFALTGVFLLNQTMTIVMMRKVNIPGVMFSPSHSAANPKVKNV